VKKKILLSVLAVVLVVTMLVTFVLPVLAEAPDYLDVEGVYDVMTSATMRYMDGTSHAKQIRGTLTITTQVGKAITDATLTTLGTDIALTGIVGGGTRPYLSLSGTDSDGQYANMYFRVTYRSDAVTKLTGRIDGYATSDGARWDGSEDGTSEVSVVQARSGVLSCLLTAGTLASPEALIFHEPNSRLRVKDLDSLSAGRNGLSFYYYASDATCGPEVMLRFAPRGNDTMTYYGGGTSGLVDITIMPLQTGATTGEWTKCTITSDSGACIYYGNDPTDYTSFGGTPVATVGGLEAAINAEVAMTAGGDSCSDWVLTMVSVELWEGGARTVYIDDVQIDRYTYSLEPALYFGSFSAKPAD